MVFTKQTKNRNSILVPMACKLDLSLRRDEEISYNCCDFEAIAGKREFNYLRDSTSIPNLIGNALKIWVFTIFLLEPHHKN